MELIEVMNNLTLSRPEEPSEQKFFKSVAAEIDGIHTEIVLAEFSDKTFVIATQYKKIGSMFIVQKDQVHSPLGSNDVYTTKVVFGASGETQEVAARYLAEAIKISKPLCIFLSLKSYDVETLKACKDIILDIRTETD